MCQKTQHTRGLTCWQQYRQGSLWASWPAYRPSRSKLAGVRTADQRRTRAGDDTNERPELHQRIVGINVPPEACTSRAIGGAPVPDYRFRTDTASVRMLLNGLRRWEAEELSENFLLGPVNDWTDLTRVMLDGADAMLATAGIVPHLIEQTPGSYLVVFRARLAALAKMINEEAERRANDEDPKREPTMRDLDMVTPLESHSQQTRARAAIRALTWLKGDNPDRAGQPPAPRNP